MRFDRSGKFPSTRAGAALAAALGALACASSGAKVQDATGDQNYHNEYVEVTWTRPITDTGAQVTRIDRIEMRELNGAKMRIGELVFFQDLNGNQQADRNERQVTYDFKPSLSSTKVVLQGITFPSADHVWIVVRATRAGSQEGLVIRIQG